MSYDRAGPDEAPSSEPDSAKYRCVCPYGDAFFDPGFDWNPIRIAASRHEIVSENGVWTKKHVVC